MKYFLLYWFFLIISCQQKDKDDDYMVDFDSNNFNCLVLSKMDGHYEFKDAFGSIIKVDGAIITKVTSSKIETDTISKEGEVISAKILDYKSNFKFGLVLQKPIYELSEYGKVRPSEFDKAIEKSNRVNYWIIVKKGNMLYGPLTKMEYIKKRKELGVRKELQLDED